jgi:hypothetical protein
VRKKSTESVAASSASWETLSESRLLPASKRRTEEVGRLLPEPVPARSGPGRLRLSLARSTDDLRAGPESQRPAHGQGHQNDRSPGGGRMTRPRSIGPQDANLSQRMTIQKGQYPMTRPAHPKHRTGGLAS